MTARMIVWTVIRSAPWARWPVITALRRTGVTSTRSRTPRSMSSSDEVPAQPPDDRAAMATMAGSRNAR
jgi:hypothetical protein